jgi:hypothetical protein
LLVVDIHQLIAALNADAYCDEATRRQVKKLRKEGKAQRIEQTLSTAAGKARLVEPNAVDLEHLEEENPFRLPGFRSPVERHTLVYDSFDESMEAFYFWLLDELAGEDWTVSKLADTFLATPGSGLSSDLVRRQTQAQHEAMKLLREAQALIHDILRTAAVHFDNKSRAAEITLSTAGSRSEAETNLLRSKIETLKLYARWLGPYLRQARQLEHNAHSDAGLVSVFNTAAVEVTLLAEREHSVEEEVDRGELPKMFLKAKRRAYFAVLVIELKLRAAPERISSGAYGYRGRFELMMTSYGLNPEEMTVLREEIDRESLGEVMASVGGKASETLNQLLSQMESLVAEPAKPEAKTDDPNPFLALFGLEDRRSESEGEHRSDAARGHWWSVKGDTDVESVIRSQAILDARRRCLEFYNRCKAKLGMAGS